MPNASRTVDYLVIGAGATGLAFADAVIAESDATLLLVDRRANPGGHWNDAYPFVRLHQPSAYYGVNSVPLGQNRIVQTGPEQGFYERATGAEICHYFQTVLEDRLLASGQAEFLPVSDCLGDDRNGYRAVSRMGGAEHEITVRRKVVDARYLESSIPATHTPNFVVGDDTALVPVNLLPRAEHAAGTYVVIGAGKTAMDACTWLLDNDVDPDRITWVKPREPWVVDRANFQPLDGLGQFIIGWAAATEAAAAATSVADLFDRLETCGQVRRVDPSVEPTMFRLAILSDWELSRLRTIEHVVRAGHVRRIDGNRMQLDAGDVTTAGDCLYVDCSAEGLPRPAARPVFEPRRVTVQPIREASPTFNAAVIGHLEATAAEAGRDTEQLNALAPTNPYPSLAEDWLRIRHIGLVAETIWSQTPDVAGWLEGSRLNIAAGLADHAHEPGVGAAIGSYLEHNEQAIANLARLRTELGDEVTVRA